MSVWGLLVPPACHAHYPEQDYLYLRLYDEQGTYGYAAVAEHGDCLELHLEMTRWGPQARRGLAGDLEWLKARARARGKVRITGLRQEPDQPDGGLLPVPDPRWAKFTRMFGFTGQCVLQAAFLDLDNGSAG